MKPRDMIEQTKRRSSPQIGSSGVLKEWHPMTVTPTCPTWNRETPIPDVCLFFLQHYIHQTVFACCCESSLIIAKYRS